MLVHQLTVRLFDGEAAGRAVRAEPSLTRTRLLQSAVVDGGAIVAGGVLLGGLPAVATAARSKEQDIRILNLVLLLEELEAAFYADAQERGALRGGWPSSPASWAITSELTSPSCERRLAAVHGRG